jgi:CYTH domain-containing protein
MSGVEVERKWIVEKVPQEALSAPFTEIDQGYLTVGSGGAETRVRRRDDDFTLTVKSGSGLSRAEHETEISREQFEALWPATEGSRIRKRRHTLPASGGLEIELDVYGGSLEGLIVAEVEFGDPWAAESFEVPIWFGREVTDDSAYKNQRLALEGLPASS